MDMKRYVSFVLLFVLSCVSTPKSNEERKVPFKSTLTHSRLPNANGDQVLMIGDIHFDPLYDPKLVTQLIEQPAETWEKIFESSKVSGVSKPGADPNYPLLVSSLKAMKFYSPHPGLILIAGDYFRHKSREELAKY